MNQIIIGKIGQMEEHYSKVRVVTMCIIHKGFRDFRAVSIASALGGNLISLKPVIPYEIIHSPLNASGGKFFFGRQNITGSLSITFNLLTIR